MMRYRVVNDSARIEGKRCRRGDVVELDESTGERLVQLGTLTPVDSDTPEPSGEDAGESESTEGPDTAEEPEKSEDPEKPEKPTRRSRSRKSEWE